MKNKGRIFIALALLFLAILFFWFRSDRKPLTEPTELANEAVTQPASNASSNPVSTGQQGTPFPGNVVRGIERQKEMRQDLERSKDDWRTPISFFGKVVDEASNAVSGAKVDFSCNDLSPSGTSFYHTVSDSAGNFSITRITGKLLSVAVTKDGYYSSSRDNHYYTYAGENVNFVPDPQNPIMFHLRKKGAGQDLIATDFPGFAKMAQLKRDGTPVEINLLNGTVASAGAGSIKLELWHDPLEKSAQPFDWKTRLTVPGGGLVEATNEFNFEAPATGYETSAEINMLASATNWQNETKRTFFVNLPDGNYGRIEFYLLARNGVFTLHSFINGSGSKNLEPK